MYRKAGELYSMERIQNELERRVSRIEPPDVTRKCVKVCSS